MIKQKFTLTLGLISILLGALAASPPRANAGQAVPPGNTPDSSGLIGDTARVQSLFGTPASVISPITGVSLSSGDGGNVIITITGALQTNLIAAAAALFSPTSTTPVSEPIANLLTGVTTGNLPTFNVPEGAIPLVNALSSALNNLIVRDSSGAVISVDVNQLEQAITAYNNLVNGAAPNALQQLSQDPNFRATGRILESLRASLN